MRKKPNKQKLEATRRAWDRGGRQPRSGNLLLVPDLDSKTLAVNRSQAEEAIRILKDNNIEFQLLGPLGEICQRPDHQREEE